MRCTGTVWEADSFAQPAPWATSSLIRTSHATGRLRTRCYRTEHLPRFLTSILSALALLASFGLLGVRLKAPSAALSAAGLPEPASGIEPPTCGSNYIRAPTNWRSGWDSRQASLRESELLANIQVGETTRQQVMNLLGEPDSQLTIEVAGSIREWWSYTYASACFSGCLFWSNRQMCDQVTGTSSLFILVFQRR